jgi:teichuronic acid biosynthesis glycosyltransferase TuaH
VRPEQVATNVLRVDVPALPGVTRPGVRRITAFLLDRAVRRALSDTGLKASAVVVAFPLARFPRAAGGRKILYVTDDWVDGSPLMGFSPKQVRRVLAKNIAEAGHVAAVSDDLIRTLQRLARTWKGGGAGPHFTVLPNGCPDPAELALPLSRQPVAGLIGQLNERLDLDVLEAVQAAGVSITVIGPRAERDPAFRTRLDRLLARDNVQWLGRIDPDDLASRLVNLGVGLTPYADTKFNRASFPLKTLEYLAGGVPVVSTDMPAARWLNTEHVTISENPAEFARNVVQALAQREDRNQSLLRQGFAAKHSWTVRAQQFLDLVKA